jgi:hypothetical protein
VENTNKWSSPSDVVEEIEKILKIPRNLKPPWISVAYLRRFQGLHKFHTDPYEFHWCCQWLPGLLLAQWSCP